MHVSKLSEFIQSDVPSDTLLLIRNEFGTVFELGAQRLETLEELDIQYSQALAKPEREMSSQLVRSSHVQSDSHRILFACILLFLIAAIRSIKHRFYHNFSPQNNGAHVKVNNNNCKTKTEPILRLGCC